jgi:hypothetical protein
VERVLAGVLGSGVLLLLAVVLTRAGRRRILCAMAGGVAGAALNVAVDVAASTAGLWRYPGVSTPYAPLWYYAGALLGMAAIALIVWRLDRRYGWPGVGAALGASAILFPIRDYRVAATTELIEFADGVAPFVADGAAAVAVVGISLVVMRVGAGPAQADPLVGRRW